MADSQDSIQMLADLLSGKKNPYQFTMGMAPQEDDSDTSDAVRAPTAQPTPPVTSPSQFIQSQQAPVIQDLQKAQTSYLQTAAQKGEQQAAAQKEGKDLITQWGSNLQGYQPDPQRMQKIQDLNTQLMNTKTPDRDPLTQAILSFGPALLGSAFGGQAGLQAVEPAAQQGEQIYSKLEQNQLLKSKMTREQITAQMQALQNLENRSRMDFKDQRNVGMKWLEIAETADKNAADSAGKDKELALKQAADAREKASQYGIKMPEEMVAANQKQQEVNLKKTPGQGELDKKFAEEYEKWVASGGITGTQKNLAQLDDVINKLETKSNSVTGRMEGLLPRQLQTVIDPESAALVEKGQQVGMQTLKDTFGARVTTQDMLQSLNKFVNPAQNPSENVARLKAFKQQIMDAALQKESAARYFENNQSSLQGYKGKIDIPLPDPDKQIHQAPAQAAPVGPQMSREDKLNFLNSLAKTKAEAEAKAAKAKQGQ